MAESSQRSPKAFEYVKEMTEGVKRITQNMMNYRRILKFRERDKQLHGNPTQGDGRLLQDLADEVSGLQNAIRDLQEPNAGVNPQDNSGPPGSHTGRQSGAQGDLTSIVGSARTAVMSNSSALMSADASLLNISLTFQDNEGTATPMPDFPTHDVNETEEPEVNLHIENCGSFQIINYDCTLIVSTSQACQLEDTSRQIAEKVAAQIEWKSREIKDLETQLHTMRQAKKRIREKEKRKRLKSMTKQAIRHQREVDCLEEKIRQTEKRYEQLIKEERSKFKRFVIRLEETHRPMRTIILNKDRLPGVVEKLLVELNVHLVGIDSGLEFLMEAPIQEWQSVVHRQDQIHKMLEELFPEDVSDIASWQQLEACDPIVMDEDFRHHQETENEDGATLETIESSTEVFEQLTSEPVISPDDTLNDLTSPEEGNIFEEARNFQVVTKLRIVIVGKTGNGKSSLGNILLEKEVFPIGSGISSTTVKASTQTSAAGDIEVVDTPDLVNCEMEKSAEHEVGQWKKSSDSVVTTAVVVAIRCDVLYTAEEYAIYRQVKELWGKDLCKHLVVAFTFGDRLDLDPVKEKEKFDRMLQTVCPELQSVLRDADNRYVVFDCSTGQYDPQRHGKRVPELLKLVKSERSEKPGWLAAARSHLPSFGSLNFFSKKKE